MIQVREEDIDRITAAFHGMLKGKAPDTLDIATDYADNEIGQMIDYINRFFAEYNETANLAYLVAKGDIAFSPPKSKLLIAQSLKTLQATLKHLTWTTKQIAKGDFAHTVDFMGEFSEAYNSMTRQLQQSFAELETKTRELRQKVEEQDRTRRAMLNILEDLEASKKVAGDVTRKP